MSEQCPGRIKVFATTIAALYAVSACSSQGEDMPLPDVPHEPVATQSALPPGACPPPSSEDLETVKKLMDEPRGPAELRRPYLNQSDTRMPTIDQLKSGIAKQLGVKVVRTDNVADRMSDQTSNVYNSDNPDDPTAVPYRKILKRGNQETRKLGFEIVTGNHKKDPNVSKKSEPRRGELEDTGRLAVRGILYAIDDMPQSTLTMAGLKQIVLIGGDADASFADRDSHRLYFLINDLDADTIKHEIEHMIDHDLCDGNDEYNDPGFAAFNNNAKIYSLRDNRDREITFDTEHPSLENKEHRIDTLEGKAVNAFMKRDTEKLNRLKSRIDTTKNSLLTLTDYHTGVIEDKAEFGQLMFTPGDWYKLDPAMPTLNNKFLYLLARYYAHDPAGAKFLIKTSIPYTPPIYLKYDKPPKPKPVRLGRR